MNQAPSEPFPESAPPARPKTSRIRAILLAVAMVVPFLWTLHLSREFTVSMPKGDHWTIAARFLSLSIEGKLKVSDLWAQDNDSRMMVPRAFHIALARATAWDVKAETTLCVLLAFLAVFAAWRLVRRTFPGNPGYQLAGVFWLAILVASPLQWMNWTFGVIIAYFSVVLSAVLVVVVFSTSWHYLAKLTLGILLALVATQSFICGWIVWVEVAALALWTRPLPRPPLRWLAYALTLGLAVVYGLWFFQGYRLGGGAGHAGSLSLFGKIMVFFLGLIGAPFSEMLPVANSTVGPWIGAASLVWLAVSVVLLGFLARREAWFLAWPWLVMCGWSLSVLGMIAVGRVQLDPQAAYWSRYMAFSVWFHGANFVLALLAWRHVLRGRAGKPVLLWKMAALLSGAGLVWRNGGVGGARDLGRGRSGGARGGAGGQGRSGGGGWSGSFGVVDRGFGSQSERGDAGRPRGQGAGRGRSGRRGMVSLAGGARSGRQQVARRAGLGCGGKGTAGEHGHLALGVAGEPARRDVPRFDGAFGRRAGGRRARRTQA